VFKELGISIENSIKDEDELKYFLNQKDSKGRTVLTILSKNRFYTMLEDNEIGTIVSKMWMGSKRNYGILGGSTVHNSAAALVESDDAMQFSRPIDRSKPYMFHFEQWLESCS
jgi:hypothetical protein